MTLLNKRWMLTIGHSLRDIYVGEDLTFPDNFKTNEFVRYVFKHLLIKWVGADSNVTV